MNYLQISDVKLIIPSQLQSIEAAIELFSKYINDLDEMDYDVVNRNIIVKPKKQLSEAQILEKIEEGDTSVRFYPVSKKIFVFLDGSEEVARFENKGGNVEYYLGEVVKEHNEFSLNNYSVLHSNNAVLVGLRKRND